MRLRVKLALHLTRFQSYELLKRSDTRRGPINSKQSVTRGSHQPPRQSVSQSISHSSSVTGTHYQPVSQPVHLTIPNRLPPHTLITITLITTSPHHHPHTFPSPR
ncbi:hypothetical protein E2C01_085401 [Portunus trituberculatus]|uniref:Uncharacterized protein n=1 Tax=Portunus trituberculatus TaxID=210409 RepID=A0A5B7JDI0_PORTR|nr:hypothetical protein [Portunus trituberculatus]